MLETWCHDFQVSGPRRFPGPPRASFPHLRSWDHEEAPARQGRSENPVSEAVTLNEQYTFK